MQLRLTDRLLILVDQIGLLSLIVIEEEDRGGCDIIPGMMFRVTNKDSTTSSQDDSGLSILLLGRVLEEDTIVADRETRCMFEDPYPLISMLWDLFIPGSY